MKSRKIFGLWLLSLMFFLCLWGSVYSLSLPSTPTQDIYIQDYAGMLSTEVKRDMLNMGYRLQEKTTAELVVVTVTSLEGSTVEEYAIHLFRKWGIGDSNKNNGTLLLIAEEEGEARIEVGYGLEGILNDGKVGAILDKMIPYFQQADYSVGVATAYSLLIQEIATEYGIDSNDIFTAGEVIIPTTLNDEVSLLEIILFIGVFIIGLLLLMVIISLLMRRNMFRETNSFIRDLLSGKYAGPTGGPTIGNSHGRRSHRNRYYRGGGFGGPKPPGGGGGFGGGFGGGSSGGGGASRKW